MRSHLPYACIIALVIVINPVYAALLTFSGAEADFWQYHAVVIGRIESPLEPTEDGGLPNRMKLHLSVTAVLRTDTIVPTDRLALKCFPEGRGTAYHNFSPSRGELYLICIGNRGGGWYLEPSILTFFASKNAIVKLDGSQDPKVQLMIQEIAKLNQRTRATAP